MAITNQERVGKGMEILRKGLAPFVEREVQLAVKTGQTATETLRRFAEDPMLAQKPIAEWDVSALLRLMFDTWNDVFKRTLGHAERSLVSELRNWRNQWAHQGPFSSRDAERALDSAARLLTAISAPEADEVERMMMELRRLTFEEQVRTERRKGGGALIEMAVSGAIKPWREVVAPHVDVATGRYQQAEFAADLWQVHLGEGTDEYRDPREFFRRTFLTESLRKLLVSGIQRLSGAGGDPVVQLQTNFGGGKTHSMLALYHAVSGTPAAELPGVDAVMAAAGVANLPVARRVVLVGNKISPGNPVRKPDGTEVRTLWGELAWQLGGREAFLQMRLDDERATSPGDKLRELFNHYGPCLILVDEWVAYARQLHDQRDLPGGDFETHFSFAQALTESAKLARGCLLVISLPASDTAGSSQGSVDDAEVGGLRGREALIRLRNVVGRIESSWRPATAEEGFEIVRRRLFEPLTDNEAFKQRDLTARTFADFYREQGAEFPPDCRAPDYEKRLRAAYPIHPEVFDQLYGGWSTLVKFQRTRGVLRLMAAVINSLWEKGDRGPLIMPSSIPIDDGRVQNELTRYLSDNWVPIIERDVDGPSSTPLRIDGEHPNLGRLSATRRVARTIYLGSAPTTGAAHLGLEDRQVKLGCVLPGESPAIFADAIRRLATAATYLYQDGPRSWYSTQPTVTKLAEDRAEQLKRDPDRIAQELERRLRENLRATGDFTRIHPLPQTGADVADDRESRLVVLGAEHLYAKDGGGAAVAMATRILESRGSGPRLFRNTLVFLAADSTRMPELDEAIRKYLAWQSIVNDKDALNLVPNQVRSAETRLAEANGTVAVRLPEVYLWLLVPEQKTPAAPMHWNVLKLTGNDPLAVRASRKLRNDELMVPVLGPSMLRRHMDAIPLWRGNHVDLRQLADDFASYLYLPRVAGPDVIATAARDGVALMTWATDSFAYAEGYDAAAGRYQGLRAGQQVGTLSVEMPGLLVKPEVALAQLDAETAERASNSSPAAPGPGPSTVNRAATGTGSGAEGASVVPASPGRTQPKRYYATVTLDPMRSARDAGRIAEEVLAHLVGLSGTEVTVTLEIQATSKDGFSEQIVRIVSENGRTLRFQQQGFEVE
jgi:predicted AAA+ superfamily ATPase